MKMSDLLNYVYPNVYSSPGDGYDSEVVIKDSAGALLYVSGLLAANESAVFLQAFDGYVAPTTGDHPVLSIPIEPTTTLAGFAEYRATLNGIRFANGIVLATSSSASRYTPDGGDGCFIHCLFV